MKKLAIILASLLASLAIADEQAIQTSVAAGTALGTVAITVPRPCPEPCKVVIRGPCPSPCVPCPAAAQCPDCVCNPAPSVTVPGPPVAVPALCTSDAAVIRYVTSSVPPSGHWFVPVSALYIPSWSDSASYVETVPHSGHPEDPSIEVSRDWSYGLGAGLGYEFANRVSVSGQYIWLEEPSTGVRFSHAPDSRLQAHGLGGSGGGPGYALAVTVAVPLGR